MCGRATLSSPLQKIIDGFAVREWVEQEDGPPRRLHPRYNLRPTDAMLTIVVRDGRRVLRPMRWGFQRPWTPRPLFNARADTLRTSDTWREAFRARRCLVIADGFYEWPEDKRPGRQAQYIYLRSRAPFGFAALYERDAETDACAICTCAANELVAAIPHSRMPVILPPEHHAAWLDPENRDEDALLALLQPYPAGEMGAHLVGRHVNRGDDDARCIEPVGDVDEPTLF